MPRRVSQDAMQLEEELDRAGKDVPGTTTVDKSGLPTTWFGYLWKIEPKLFLASAFMQLAWSSCTILAAYYFVNEMTANRNSKTFNQQRGLELCFGYLGTITAIAVTFQLKNLWVGQMGANMKSRLSARVAEHALLRGSTSSADKSLALVLASQDAHNICEGAKCVWQLPAAISEGIVIVALVIWRSGSISGGITAGLLIGGFIALFSMSLYMTALKKELSVVQDKQVSLFYEVLANIRPFRLLRLGPFLFEQVEHFDGCSHSHPEQNPHTQGFERHHSCLFSLHYLAHFVPGHFLHNWVHVDADKYIHSPVPFEHVSIPPAQPPRQFARNFVRQQFVCSRERVLQQGCSRRHPKRCQRARRCRSEQFAGRS